MRDDQTDDLVGTRIDYFAEKIVRKLAKARRPGRAAASASRQSRRDIRQADFKPEPRQQSDQEKDVADEEPGDHPEQIVNHGRPPRT